MTESELATRCKMEELGAIEEARKAAEIPTTHQYFAGKAAAYADVWELLVFNGGRASPKEYNRANENWSRRVEELRAASLPG